MSNAASRHFLIVQLGKTQVAQLCFSDSSCNFVGVAALEASMVQRNSDKRFDGRLVPMLQKRGYFKKYPFEIPQMIYS